MNHMIRWSVFRSGSEVAVVPQTPLLIRLRAMTPDTFFQQAALAPLKSFTDLNFIIGPVCILAAAYLPSGSVALASVGLLSLAFSAIYWFASHWLCARYLRYRGFTEAAAVDALDYEAARAAAGETA